MGSTKGTFGKGDASSIHERGGGGLQPQRSLSSHRFGSWSISII
jgi:hypothetical protein